MAETTLNGLIELIARRYGYVKSGTTTAGSTTSITDSTNLLEKDNFWAGHSLRLTSGALSGTERLLSSSSQASTNASFLPAVGSTIAVGVTYLILPRPQQDFIDAVNEAIRAAGREWVALVDDTSSFTLSGVQQYSLPAATIVVIAVYAGDGSYWQPLRQWEVIGQPGSLKLLLRESQRDPDNQIAASSQVLRVVYASEPGLQSSGTGVLGVGENNERGLVSFIQEYALHILHESAFSRNVTGEGARAHMSKAQNHLAKAMEIKRQAPSLQQQQRSRIRHIPKQIQG